MITPDLPLWTGDDVVDLEKLKVYLSDLDSTLRNLNTAILEAAVESGYVAIGIAPDTTFAVGDTLAQTQHFIGTLVQSLIRKGVIAG